MKNINTYKTIGLVILFIILAIMMMSSGATAGAATAASTIFTTLTYIIGLAFAAVGAALIAKFKK